MTRDDKAAKSSAGTPAATFRQDEFMARIAKWSIIAPKLNIGPQTSAHEDMPEKAMLNEYQAKTLKPTRSAPVRFKGRIIAETQWDTRDGCWMRFTVWETRGGAYITEISGDAPGKPDQVHCTVGIVEPIMYYPDPQRREREAALAAGKIWAGEWPAKTPERDQTAMQIAVLDKFEWHDRAKRMLKNELGWAPYVEVA